MYCLKIFPFICIFLFSVVFAETLEITKDGNYVSLQRFSLSESSDIIYNITGTIELNNSPKNLNSYVIIGLVPYDLNGNSLQDTNDFPLPFAENQDGYITLDTLELVQEGKYSISKRIKLGGEVKSVSFVIGASLADGAKILISDFQLIAENNAPNIKTSSNSSLIDSPSNSAATKVSNSENPTNTIIFQKEETTQNAPKTKQNVAFDTKRIIFVNSYLGSDNLSGLKRDRGQIDGPKKTIKSALNIVGDGDNIVLQESNLPYEISTAIKPKAGQKLVIRAEGKAVIKFKK